MNIYEEGGDRLDIDAARRELRATELVSSEPMRKTQQGIIQIAAMLDVAASLRTLALESALAMRGLDTYAPDEPDEEAPVEDFLVVGDLVHLDGVERVGTIVKLGFDGDHEMTADVDFGEGAAVMTYYAKSLVRLVGDEKPEPTLEEIREASAETPLIGVATPDETLALLDDADDDGEDAVGGYELDEALSEVIPVIEPEELVDDIDADFDGAIHPEAESAVDVLRRNEEKRKAAKKATAKKGKKS